MNDVARKVAFNPAAPADERADAMAEMQKAHMPRSMSDLIPRAEIQPIIDHINNSFAEQEMAKARGGNVIAFPNGGGGRRQPGMQSLFLDDMQINIQGDWYERPGAFSFDSMRAMVAQTPILNGVIMQRIRQVQRFARPQKSGKGPGFKVSLRDQDDNVDEKEKETAKLLESFITNCGWETKARRRQQLKRDNFSTFLSKAVRDTLTMDSMAIETEYKRNRELGMDGFYAIDGATIRLCTEEGYRGDDEIFALQVVQGTPRTTYGYDSLIYVPRNPTTDVTFGGYGMSETELLIRVVTGFLNAFNYNTKYFDSNAIPKGMLHLQGNYDDGDIAAFKRYWNGMVKGVNNAWQLPVMVSKDQESKASFENFGVDVNELMFGKWMTFLASIICAIYGMAPEEINIESFTTGASSLSGSDTEEKLVNSKDKGLRPLLSYMENIFSEYVIGDFSDKYEFCWTGLDEEDEKSAFERKKLVLTVNELRAEDGLDAVDGAWGDAPLNPSLVSVWQAEQQPAGDFGQPGQDDGGEEGEAPQGPDFGSPGEGQDTGADFGSGEEAPPEQPGAPAAPAAPAPMQKAFGLPAWRVPA